MPRGGSKAPDNKPRASGPGAFSRRTDLDGSQPIRAPGGQDYGERTALEQQQMGAPVPEGGALGESPAPSGPAPDLVGLLSSVGSQRPSEDIMTGSGQTASGPPLAPRELVEGVEYLIQTLPSPSEALVDFYLRLRADELQ